MAEGPPGVTTIIDALRRAPRVPDEPGLFSADSDTVGPGIYDGPPMEPMSGPERTAATVETQLSEVALDPDAAARWHHDPRLARLVPDDGVRAGVAALVGTVAEPAMHQLLAGHGIGSLRYGTPHGAGRIAGHTDGTHSRVVNDRYRHEHPGLIAGPIAHEILCHPTPRCDAEEKLLHAALAMVHMQLLAQAPNVASIGSELARRVNSMTVSLYNSRRPDSPRFALIAPDGPGTIPGGRPAMQTPDFWSIPFLTGHPDPAPVPPPVVDVLGRLGVARDRLGGSPVYDDGVAHAVDEAPGLDWLGWEERGAVGAALGVL